MGTYQIEVARVRKHRYYVYIVASKTGRLYVGMTNDLFVRVWQHKAKIVPGFTATYNIDRLVYSEPYRYVWDAIAREKQIKAWRRSKKVALIQAENSQWLDLAADWYDEIDPEKPPTRRWL